MIRKDYMVALNRAVAHKRSLSRGSVSQPGSKAGDQPESLIKKNASFNYRSSTPSAKGHKSTGFNDSKEFNDGVDLMLGSARVGPTIQKRTSNNSISPTSVPRPTACPTRLIPFENKILNKTFVPHPMNPLVDESGKKITEYARFCVKDDEILFKMLENNYPELPSFILGPPLDYTGVLYVGTSQASCNTKFLRKNKIKRIIHATPDPRLTPEHFAGWSNMGIKVKVFDLHVDEKAKKQKKKKGGWFCCSSGADSRTEELREVISFLRGGLKIGGVLISDIVGFKYAPMLAATYISATQQITLEKAFAQVKAARIFSRSVPEVMEDLEERLPELYIFKPESKQRDAD
ncbi:hypothetical protein AAMO2058_000442100 [Amorphochlora amoebiformis]